MGDHFIDIVNEKDEVIGKELKSKKAELEFISRVVAIFLVDSKSRFIICKRGPHKILDADKHDLAAFGNVDAGEDYHTAASRELKEELDISCPLVLLDKFYQEIEHKGKMLKIFCAVFLGRTDDEPKLNHELVSFERMSFEEIENELNNSPDKFCPGFINDFNWVRTKLEKL